MTSDHVAPAYADPGDPDKRPVTDAIAHGIQRDVGELPAARRGAAWSARFHALSHGDKCLPAVLAGLHFLAGPRFAVFACLMLTELLHVISRPYRTPAVAHAAQVIALRRLL